MSAQPVPQPETEQPQRGSPYCSDPNCKYCHALREATEQFSQAEAEVQPASTSLPISGQHWFSAVIRFNCPSCRRISAEKMAVSSPVADADAVKTAIENQSLSCQLCNTALEEGTPIGLDVRPSTPVDLERIGVAGKKASF
jgi:hypothetical protein